MKHIIIQIESIMQYPPTLSLIKMLRELENEVTLLTAEISDDVKRQCRENRVTLVDLKYNYNSKDSALKKMTKIPLINHRINKALSDYYDDQTAIWIMTSISLKYIGSSLSGKRYIMYMYELSQELRYYQKFPLPKVPLEKLFHEAAAVIECEYNRAHIVQAWFGLKETPYVVPNKPYMDKMGRCEYIDDDFSRDIIEKIKERKIILYQGILDEERPLDPFIEAVNSLGDNYAMVVMSGNCEKLKNIKSNNLYLLPFVKPPHHLEITSWANIGILSYYPVRNATTSPLNAIYCAPNKIYEYAMFGIPMLGNNIPGLQYTLKEKKIGECLQKFDKESIIQSIKKIENNYPVYSENASCFYDEVANKEVIKTIIGSISGGS